MTFPVMNNLMSYQNVFSTDLSRFDIFFFSSLSVKVVTAILPVQAVFDVHVVLYVPLYCGFMTQITNVAFSLMVVFFLCGGFFFTELTFLYCDF